MSGELGERLHRWMLPTAVLSVDVAPDGSQIYAACMDGVYRVETSTGVTEKLDVHGSYASGVVVVPDRNVVISAGYDGALQWFDLAGKQRLRRVVAHRFWSWQLALAPDRKRFASVTGQYLAGGYKYEPQASVEPCVLVYDVDSGELIWRFDHVPSVQSVAFSRDGQFLAAGNLMGEVRVWDLSDGKLVAQWTTPDFTSWGIIKSHCYIGGIFSLMFSRDDASLYLAGMGPMRDPMAGNGRQLWQKYSWQQASPVRVDQTHDGESGEGLMETLAMHPVHDQFVMAGRLRGGEWNAARFDVATGNRLQTLKTGVRITRAVYSADGAKLVLGGATSQQRPKDGKSPDFGVIDVLPVA